MLDRQNKSFPCNDFREYPRGIDQATGCHYKYRVDESGHFGRIEDFRNVANSRATRPLAHLQVGFERGDDFADPL